MSMFFPKAAICRLGGTRLPQGAYYLLHVNSEHCFSHGRSWVLVMGIVLLTKSMEAMALPWKCCALNDQWAKVNIN